MENIIFIEGKLPSVSKRKTGYWYEKDDGSILYWDGKSLKCIHYRRKSHCKECKGSGICIHDRRKEQCKECNGSQICIHGKRKSRCKECNGSQICIHDIIKSRCKECKGASICEHNKIKNVCSSCSTNRKNFCKICDSVYLKKSTPYSPLCYRCYIFTHPDEKIPRRYKLKHYIHDKIREVYKDFEYDKSIGGGCSNKRPDFLFDRLTHSVIVEIDEEQHNGYSCENKRTMEIFKDLGSRPLILIRFNPDSYKSLNGLIDGCFTFDKNNSIVVDNVEFKNRMSTLLETIDHHLHTIPSREVTDIRLFFNE